MEKSMVMQKEEKMVKADKILDSMAETFRERNKVYGDNYKSVGAVMTALFLVVSVLPPKSSLILGTCLNL